MKQLQIFLFPLEPVYHPQLASLKLGQSQFIPFPEAAFLLVSNEESQRANDWTCARLSNFRSGRAREVNAASIYVTVMYQIFLSICTLLLILPSYRRRANETITMKKAKQTNNRQRGHLTQRLTAVDVW